MSIYYALLYFFVYGFLGWCTEVAFAAVKQKKFVNRGFLNGPICPIYGVGVTLVIIFLEPFTGSLPLLYVSSVILVTVLEGLTGWAMDKIFHNKWWDYSELPLNIGGYVCLLFSLIWGVACVLIVYLIHPLIHRGLAWLPHILGVILIVILGIALLTDLYVTSSAIFKFNKYLENLQKITDELHEISDQIGEDIYVNVIRAMEKQELTKKKLDETKLEVSEDIRMRITELKDRAQDLSARLPKVSRRLVKAFPKMQSHRYKEQLEVFRNRFLNHRKR